jgi:uncharacterized protein (TIGR00251 family)
VRLSVKVVPGARRDRVVGWLGGALKVTVGAPPERGKANEAVTRLLEAVLGVEVRLIRGAHSQRKTLEVEALDESAVRERVERALRSRARATPR